MKRIVDAHTVIWSVDQPAKLPGRTMSVMQNPAQELFFSIASIWEIAIKSSLGKLPLSLPFDTWIEKAIYDFKLTVLPISLDHVKRHHTLPFHHRDPFDRIVAAQSLADHL